MRTITLTDEQHVFLLEALAAHYQDLDHLYLIRFNTEEQYAELTKRQEQIGALLTTLGA